MLLIFDFQVEVREVWGDFQACKAPLLKDATKISEFLKPTYKHALIHNCTGYKISCIITCPKILTADKSMVRRWREVTFTMYTGTLKLLPHSGD